MFAFILGHSTVIELDNLDSVDSSVLVVPILPCVRSSINSSLSESESSFLSFSPLKVGMGIFPYVVVLWAFSCLIMMGVAASLLVPDLRCALFPLPTDHL